MATRTLQILITAQNKASKELDKVKTQAEKLTPAFKKMRNAGAVAFAGLSAGAVKMVNDAVKFDSVKTSFTRMSEALGQNGDEIVSALKKASAGTVSETDLMLSANRAYSLGVAKNTKEFTTLMEVARLKSREMGTTTTDAFNDIVVGIGRGSPMILDNLGIIIKSGEAQEQYAKSLGKTVEQLTANEKKEAIKNAVLVSGMKDVERAGELNKTYAEKMAILKTNIAETGVKIGVALLPVLSKMFEVISPIITKISEWIEKNPELTKDILLGSMAIAGLATALGIVGLALPAVRTGLGRLFSPITIITGLVVGLIAVGYKLIKNWEQTKDSLKFIWDVIGKIFDKGVGYVKEKTNSVVKVFKTVINWATKAIEAIKKYSGYNLAKNTIGRISSFGGKRALGGGVNDSSSYLVGENGPEIFTPSQSGKITPNSRISGNNGGNISITINGDVSGQELIEKVKNGIMRELGFNNKL